MKVAIILPDGAADQPLPQLAGRTPLEAARIPHMDWIAHHGQLGRVVTVPAGFTPGTDVATLSIFGYDPHECYAGRAPLEAAAKGLTASDDELIFRCNFVTIADGRMRDFTANHIDQDEADRLIADLNALFRGERRSFYAGVSYRNLLIAAGADELNVTCTPPHDIPDQPVAEHLPRGPGAAAVQEISARAARLLQNHPVNQTRRSRGRPPVTDIWLWGQGRPRRLTPFRERYGLDGVAISAVDIIRGLATTIGLRLITVSGATGYIDTNFQGKGEAAVRALHDHDLVVVHVEAPDEAGHLGDADEKVLALERVDEHIVGPVLTTLRSAPDWRILIAPDHPTPVATKAHSAEPPPFCFAGSGIPPADRLPFHESAAGGTGVLVDPGHKLMNMFLRR